MAEEQPQLTSKRKTVVNTHGFFHLPRTANDFSEEVNSLHSELYETSKYCNWYNVGSSDKVRATLGKNWDFNYRDPNNTDVGKEFLDTWGNPRLFYDEPIYLEHCGDPIEVGESGLATREKIVLQSYVSYLKAGLGGARESSWLYYMKTGAKLESGQYYSPVVKTWTGYHDHTYESPLPFTPHEMLTKQPAGKTFFADYKTYYNERTRRAFDTEPDFETTTGPNSQIQNSLPSIYGFIKFLLDANISSNDFFNLKPITNFIYTFYTAYDTNTNLLKQIYTELLKLYPLETLTVLYGAYTPSMDGSNQGTDNIVEKILSLSFDNYDADALFSKYYDDYANYITYDEKLKLPEPSAGYLDVQTNFIKSLERIMTNLAFSPNSIKTLNKVDQYKDYFPFYSEIKFTANLHTNIGDMAKKLNMTKFLSEAVLSTTSPPENPSSIYFSDLDSVTGDDGSITGAKGSWTAQGRTSPTSYEGFPVLPSFGVLQNCVEHYQDTVYEDLKNLIVKDVQGHIKQTTKVSSDFTYWTENFLEPDLEPYALGPGAGGAYYTLHENAQMFSTIDLRNYMTYFKNSASEGESLDDCNIMFKKLFGTAFHAKILDTYKQNRRSFADIMNGKKAYTEDLFYRIEKKRKLPGQDNYEVVQNILIPNTSELDIAQYVDTQLKYGAYATYQYDVYVHKLVFGCMYFYGWLDPQSADDEVVFGDVYNPTNMVSTDPLSQGADSASIYAPDFSDDLTEQKFVDDINELGNGIFVNEEDNTPFNPFADTTADPNEQFTPGVIFEELSEFEDPLAAQDQTPINSGINKTLSATFGVQVNPDIRLVEDLLFSTPEIIILDRPPVTPDVNIIPYRAINNRLKILLTPSYDRYTALPISILPQDIDKFDLVLRSQLPADNQSIEFGSDDVVNTFEIFRIQKPPQSYSDFELLDRISRQAYEEEILPNTKYYYTFRAIDSHGHISNPTPVYEVELIDEKGAVKPIIRLYEMKKVEPKSNIKACQKYIYLKPSLRQLYFADDPEADSIFTDEVKYKKYKIRLTSKGSGKKIDINFQFKKSLGGFELLDMNAAEGLMTTEVADTSSDITD